MSSGHHMCALPPNTHTHVNKCKILFKTEKPFPVAALYFSRSFYRDRSDHRQLRESLWHQRSAAPRCASLLRISPAHPSCAPLSCCAVLSWAGCCLIACVPSQGSVGIDAGSDLCLPPRSEEPLSAFLVRQMSATFPQSFLV